MKYILITLILLVTSNISAQLKGQAKIDSLEAELQNAKSDTNHVKLLIELGQIYRSKNIDTAIVYVNKGYDLANDIDWKNGIIRSYQGLGVLNSTKGDTDAAIEYYNKAIELATEEEDYYQLSRAYSNKGALYQKIEDYTNAMLNKEKAIEIVRSAKDTNGLANHLFQYAAYLISSGKYEEALKINFEAIQLWETSDFNENLDLYIRILNGIGLIYKEIEDNETALEYFNRAENFADSTNHNDGIMRVWINRANVYGRMGRYEEAEQDLKRCLEYIDKRGFFNDYNAVVMGTLASLYDTQYRFGEAIDLLQAVLDETKKRKMYYWVGNTYMSLASIHFTMTQDSVIEKLGEDKSLYIGQKYVNNQKVVEYINKAFEYFPENQIIVAKSRVYDMLATAYSFLGEHDKAYKIQKEYSVIKDSILNADNLKEIGKIEAEREALINKHQEAERARQAEELAQQRNRLQYLGIGAVVVAFGVLLLLSGRMRLREWAARALVFLSFIFLFEFILVMIDPWTDEYSEGVPIIKFGINMCLALIIFPMHQYFERKVSLKVIKPDELNTEQILEEFRKRKAESKKT